MRRGEWGGGAWCGEWGFGAVRGASVEGIRSCGARRAVRRVGAKGVESYPLSWAGLRRAPPSGGGAAACAEVWSCAWGQAGLGCASAHWP